LNVALSGAATADSFFSSPTYIASKAIDGSLTTRWLSSAGAPHWWEVSWGSSQNVKEIHFIASTVGAGEHFSEYYLEYWNGASWIGISHVTGYTDQSPTITIHSELSFTTTSVRIRTLSGNATHGIYEFRVYV